MDAWEKYNRWREGGMTDLEWEQDEKRREAERGKFDLLSGRMAMLRVDGYLERLRDDLEGADDVRTAWGE